MHLRKKSKRKPTHTLHPMCTAGNHNKKRMGVGKETVRVRGGKETVGVGRRGGKEMGYITS